MREEKTGIRRMGNPYMVLLISLVFGLAVFTGLSQAQAHSGHKAEFTLSNQVVKPAGEFSLKRQTSRHYPLISAGRDVATQDSLKGHSKGIPSRSRSGIKEETKEDQEMVFKKPPSSVGKVFGEFIAGSVLGAAVGLGAAYVGGRITYDGSWFSDLPGAFVGFSLAYPLGCALGVYLVGNIGSTTGSFSSALGAAYGGIIVGALGAYALNRVSQTASVIAFLAAPPLFATFAFNKYRHYKNPSMSSTSLLIYRSGRLDLGFPAIMAFPSAPGSSKMDWLLNLATIEF